MGFTRRAVLVMGAFIGLAGCSSDGDKSPSENDTKSIQKDTTAQRNSRYFNDDGELIVPVNNERTDSDAVSIGKGNAITSHDIDEARNEYGEKGPLATYQHIGEGSVGTQLQHTQQIVGTRHMACHWPLVAPHFRTDNFSYTNDGTKERIQLINYSFLEQPPNMIPVLRAQFDGRTETSGDVFEVGVRHKAHPDGEWLMTFSVDDKQAVHLYDEVRLNEIEYGSAARGVRTLPDTQIEVYAGMGETTSAGQIFEASQLMLDWEVV